MQFPLICLHLSWALLTRFLADSFLLELLTGFPICRETLQDQPPRPSFEIILEPRLRGGEKELRIHE